MLILRIKQAECALADQRLDEAFAIVNSEDMRAHRRGQDLAGRLARALVERGREHLKAQRFGHAEADCEKAVRLAGNLPEIAQLLSDVTAAVMAKRQSEQRQAQVVNAARQQIQQGHLTVGQRILSGAAETAGAATLLQDLAARRSTLDNLLAKAAEALQRNDWEAAVAELASARPVAGADTRLRELTGRTINLVSQRITAAMQSGRLDLADSLLRRLAPIGQSSVEVEQHGRTLEQCRLAWRRIEAGQLHDAEQVIRRLATILPAATWIEPLLSSLQRACGAIEELHAGPLALLEAAGGAVIAASPRGGVKAACPPAHPIKDALAGAVAPNGVEHADGLCARLLIQVDGVGSFYILRGRQVTIGPVSSSHVPDVGVMADAATPAATIERADDDYFLRAHLPVGVNERLTCGKLLASGDRIALSPRCRFTFAVPSPASTSAVLDVSGSRLPRADVRRVILMARELIIGPGASAHIRCDQTTEPAMLFVREGALICQSKAEMFIEDKPVTGTAAIPLDAHVRVGPISFVVTRA